MDFNTYLNFINTILCDFIHVFNVWNYSIFCTFIIGYITGSRKGLVTNILISTNEKRHHSAFYRFLDNKTWNISKVASTLFLLLLKYLPAHSRIFLIEDGTNTHKSRKNKMDGLSYFYNYHAKNGQPKYFWGHGWNTIGLLSNFQNTWYYFPLLAYMYIREKYLSHGSSYKSQVELSCELLKNLVIDSGTLVTAIVDSFYQKKMFIKSAIGNRISIIGRFKSNSVMYNIPEQEIIRRKGRPRKYGDKITFCDILSKCLTKSEILLGNGKKVDALYTEQIGLVKWCEVPIKAVGVLLENAQNFVWLYSTDLTLSIEEIIYYYGTRWNIETDFEMLKLFGGLEDYHLRKEERICRLINIILWSTSIMKLSILVLTQKGKDVWKLIPNMSWYKPRKWTINLINMFVIGQKGFFKSKQLCIK